MAQEEEKAVVADAVESVKETLEEDRSTSASPSSSADPSLSRNVSFSKLNAKAPEFVPTRTQQQQPPPPPPPPPPAAAAPMMHIYTPPPGSFHVPIHSPLAAPHVIPVHQHQHHHAQQYVPVRNPSNQNNNPYVAAAHYQGNHNHHHHHHHHHYGKKVVQTEHAEGDAAVDKDKDAASRSKTDKNGLSDEATLKLLNQVEYYFSDLNLATTDHLMRFINKDPEGYVPISVVASFKKIKAAINSNSQLATILRNSSKLIVSEDGKKVKRLHPLTESDVEELQVHCSVSFSSRTFCF
uniref:La-related protein 6B-like n=1 Tax=Rhizophora mucronata TaxID=61149 RepID=A0A2P2JZL2_RHIMU